jgi:hypothetical protein
MSVTLDEFLERIGCSQSPFTQRSAEVEENLDRYYIETTYFRNVLGDPAHPNARIYFAARGNGKTAAARMIRYLLTATTDRGAVLVVDFGRKQFNRLLNSLNRDFTRLSQQTYRQHLLRQTCLAWQEQAPRLKQAFQVQPLEFAVEQYDDLETLVEQLHCAGVLSIYFLVDGIDELEETTADPARGAAMILPLLTDLDLLEHSCMAFKFFLPREIEEFLRASHKLRTDRFDALSEEWNWSQEELLSLLRKRLEYFSNNTTSSLGPYSENPQIDLILCDNALGSPRNLIRLGNYLLEEHIKENNTIDSISVQATEYAIARLKENINKEIYTSGGLPSLVSPTQTPPQPPPVTVAAKIEPAPAPQIEASQEDLLLMVDGNDVYIGGKRVSRHPSGRELQLIQALYAKQGKTCGKDELIDLLFPGESASDEQLSSAVKRVRGKLRQSSNLDYIETIKDVGYRLIHFADS